MQEEIRDLLAKDQTKRLELKERPDTGVYVKVCPVCLFVTMLILYRDLCIDRTRKSKYFVKKLLEHH